MNTETRPPLNPIDADPLIEALSLKKPDWMPLLSRSAVMDMVTGYAAPPLIANFGAKTYEIGLLSGLKARIKADSVLVDGALQFFCKDDQSPQACFREWASFFLVDETPAT